jgi:hypothetical protein
VSRVDVTLAAFSIEATFTETLSPLSDVIETLIVTWEPSRIFFDHEP